MNVGACAVGGVVRSAIIVLFVLALPAVARADAHAWGGTIDGLEVSVVLMGFREGAGTSGWTEDGVRRFALRAAELARLTGPGARLEESVEDDAGLTLVIDGLRTPLGLRDFEGSDAEWDAVLARARELGLTPSRSARTARAVRIYTIEVAADAITGVEDPPGQLFYEACLPCTAPEAVHALTPSRRVIGVFGSRAAARRAESWLRDRGVRGRVAPL